MNMKLKELRKIIKYVKKYEYVPLFLHSNLTCVKTVDLFFVDRFVNDFPKTYRTKVVDNRLEIIEDNVVLSANIKGAVILDPFVSSLDYMNCREFHYNLKDMLYNATVFCFFGCLLPVSIIAVFCYYFETNALFIALTFSWILMIFMQLFLFLIKVAINLYVWYFKKIKKPFLYNEDCELRKEF